MKILSKAARTVCLGLSIGLACGLQAIAQSPSSSGSALVDKLCPVERSDEDSDERLFDRIMSCSSKLSVERRYTESIALAEQGLAMALKQSGEMSEDYAYALGIHAMAIGLTGASKQASKELRRYEEIKDALKKNEGL